MATIEKYAELMGYELYNNILYMDDTWRCELTAEKIEEIEETAESDYINIELDWQLY